MALPGLWRRIPKKYMNTTSNTIAPRPVWTWYVFGKQGNNAIMVCNITFPVPLWRRILTRVLLGSVWERCT